MTREDGYYWVKNDGKWLIGRWDYCLWFLTEYYKSFKDSDFDEIDERRIERC